MRNTLNSIHHFSPRRAQWCATGCEGLDIVQQETATDAIQFAGAFDSLLWPREVDLGGVLHQQYNLLCGHPLFGPLDMWLNDFLERGLFVVEKAISGLDFCTPTTGGWDA